MTTTRFTTDWQPERPFRAFGLTFAALAILFCLATPFMHDIPNRWNFLFGGLGYSGFLAFIAIGLSLLSRPMRSRVFIAMALAIVATVCFLVAIFCVAHFQLPLSLIAILLRSTLWVLYPFVAAMLGFACYGWYFKVTHIAAKESSSSL